MGIFSSKPKVVKPKKAKKVTYKTYKKLYSAIAMNLHKIKLHQNLARTLNAPGAPADFKMRAMVELKEAGELIAETMSLTERLRYVCSVLGIREPLFVQTFLAKDITQEKKLMKSN